jgi:hypothetical protein
MSLAAGVIAIVLVVFFLVGVAVGVIVVFALSARRADKAEREEPWPQAPRADWPYLGDPDPDPDPDDEEPGPPSWWQDRGGR